MGQQKGGKKLRRSGKKANYYKAQAIRTARNKANQAAKRRRRKEHWALVKACSPVAPAQS